MLRHVLCIALLVFLTVVSDLASAQAYPAKPVRMISNSPGGGGEIAARLVAQGLSASLGQQVVIDPRGGSGGSVAGEMLAKAPPDGYTITFYSATLWLGPLMRDKPTYDVVRDFAAISLVASAPNTLVVHPSLPVATVKELIALAKARPGALNYGSSGTGSTSHIAGELFKAMADVNIVRVNYKGVVPAITDVVAGNVQLTFGSAGTVIPHMKSGRLKALGVASVRPSALFPGLPTVASSGLPGFESGSMFGMFAPAQTPAAIISRLNQDIVKVLAQADVKEKFLIAGTDVVGSSPEEFMASVKAEIARVGKIVRDTGMRVE